ncbi:MAG: hypothetical protein RI973_1224 [Bacteroidota bacterium]|jgi:predicted Zn-dependent peptidase
MVKLSNLIPGDPLSVHQYTLANGLRLYLSVNDAEPRIYTHLAVRAGSKHDPSETTGLAHYLEHMMFKGTRHIGTLDWPAEEQLLQQISDLYEQHRFERDPERRREIYRQIDAVSNQAACLAAANEYDKLIRSLGARGTNAYTWVEQTVYINDVPSNELERWMRLESERFREVALRLFHTELETVYEEFNMSQDRDFRKVGKVMNELLFPDHPYGTRTTMGEGEHLKNPSHVKIQEFFRTYYRPNNMALIMSGDFEVEEAVQLAAQYFGSWEPAPIPAFSFEKQAAEPQVRRREVFGQEAPYVQIGWRFEGAHSADADFLIMIGRLLSNGRAGIMDLDLLQQQLLLEARAGATVMEDLAAFQLYGKPREGQELEEVEQLLLEALEKIKSGDFPDWLPSAVVRDFKLSELRAQESNGARVSHMTDAFILGLPWEEYVTRFDRLQALGKEAIVRFAREKFQDDFAVVYKRSGDDPSVMKVEKPPITPVPVNRDAVSAFAAEFLQGTSPSLAPRFIDYEKEIASLRTSAGIGFDYVKNTANATFSLHYIAEMGRNSDNELALAVSYLPYLGTGRYTPDQLRQEFFRLGLNFGVSVSNDRVFVSLSGLDESLEAGIRLFEHVLSDARPDGTALQNLVDDVLLQRENDKKNKGVLLQQALYNFARYGADSPYTNRLPAEALRAADPARLLDKIHGLSSYEHRIFYYGSRPADEVVSLLDSCHQAPAVRRPVLPARVFPELPTRENSVLFLDFPMVQAEIMLLSRGTERFNLEEHVMAEWYNSYFGAGLSSIVFQEIRESRALAYSANALYLSPQKASEAHYLRTYVGTQADKLREAIEAMQGIVEDMPASEYQMMQAALSIQKKLETSRVKRENIYWDWRSVQERGYGHDLRRDVYQAISAARPADLLDFHNKYVRGRQYTFVVLGSKQAVDLGYLSAIGPVRETRVEELMP